MWFVFNIRQNVIQFLNDIKVIFIFWVNYFFNEKFVSCLRGNFNLTNITNQHYFVMYKLPQGAKSIEQDILAFICGIIKDFFWGHEDFKICFNFKSFKMWIIRN